jgi:putative transposase
VIEAAAGERAVAPGRLTLGTDNGSTFSSRAFRRRSQSSGSPTVAAATATRSSKRSSSPGSQSSNSAGVWREEFETLGQARGAIGAYVDSYHHRPHSWLAYRTPRKVAQT